MKWVDLCAVEYGRIEELLARGKGRRRLQGWLAEAFVRAFLGLQTDPRFRAAAVWSLVRLAPAGSSRERAMVLEVDRSSRRFALALQNAASLPECRKELLSEADLQALACAAGNGWIDLVRGADYFGGPPDLHLHTAEDALQQRFRRSLGCVGKAGDLVQGYAFARIAFWCSLLEEASQRIGQCLPDGDPLQVQLKSEQSDLARRVHDLEGICFEPEGRRLREAAATLVQAYAAFEHAPRLDWFPGGADLRKEGDRFRAVWGLGPRVVTRVGELSPRLSISLCRRIAACIDDFRDCGHRRTDTQPLLEHLKREHLLVAVDGDQPALFWKGQLLEVDWNRQRTSWDLLLRFVRNPGRILGAGGSSDAPSRSQMSRLLGILISVCPELEPKFETVRRAGYRLTLQRAEVRLLKSRPADVLVVAGRRLPDVEIPNTGPQEMGALNFS